MSTGDRTNCTTLQEDQVLRGRNKKDSVDAVALAVVQCEN